jgi:uncharacterized SAM-binding protein YcdF (DUF218 family)
MKRLFRIGLFLIAVWLMFACGLAAYTHLYGQTDRQQNADVIVVLGAGLRRNGSPGPALIRRAQQGAALYHAGVAPRIICSGGYIEWIGRSEAEGCAEVLTQAGVPRDAIILEEASRSTEENAMHTREVMQENGWQTAVIVTDSYHILRAEWIFSQEGVTVYSSPVNWREVRLSAYGFSLAREVAALHWQFIKTVLGLHITYIPGI